MTRKVPAQGIWCMGRQSLQAARLTDQQELVVEQANYQALLPTDYVEYYANRCKAVGLPNIPVLEIAGTLMRGGNYYVGYEEYGQLIMQNDQDPEVTAQVLKINSVGGKIDGLAQLMKIIGSTRKPVVVYTSCLLSAAYLMASPADHIMVENQLVSVVGSLSPVLVVVDDSDAQAKAGFKTQIILADAGLDKYDDGEGKVPVPEALYKEYKSTLNELHAWIKKTVKMNRAGVLKSDEVFSGKCYSAAEALKLGLADSVGFLDDAIKLALTL